MNNPYENGTFVFGHKTEVSMNEVTLLLNTNKPHNPYIRLHMILDMLENVPDDYVIDKMWIGRELQEIFDMFASVAEEKYIKKGDEHE